MPDRFERQVPTTCQHRAMSPVAKTKDAGWELGVRRTTSASLERTWAQLLGPGLATWLGDASLELTRVVERLVRDLDAAAGRS